MASTEEARLSIPSLPLLLSLPSPMRQTSSQAAGLKRQASSRTADTKPKSARALPSASSTSEPGDNPPFFDPAMVRPLQGMTIVLLMAACLSALLMLTCMQEDLTPSEFRLLGSATLCCYY